MLGNNTGSFNQDGEMIAGTYAPGNDVKPNLKFPRFQLGYATHIGRGASIHAGVGASQRIYSASFALETNKQDYDLQGIIYTASLAAASPFYNKVGNSAITVQKCLL